MIFWEDLLICYFNYQIKVEADGIEMKYPPRDLTPRRYVYHQRFTEQDPGAPGIRVSEKTWHEGGS